MAGFDEIQWSGELNPRDRSTDDLRTRPQRAADAVTWFCGTWTFVFLFAGFTAAWVVLNVTEYVWHPFDPYPFILLNLVFTVIELFQGPIILMSQNREMERDRDRDRQAHAKLDRIIRYLGAQANDGK